FVILYEIKDAADTWMAVAYLFSDESARDIAGRAANRIYIPEWNGVLQRFPYDFRIRHLRVAADPRRARKHLNPVLKKAGKKWRGFKFDTAIPRGYWPGKRCQFEYCGDNGLDGRKRFYAKVYREWQGRDVIALHGALREAGLDGRNGFQVPRPIGFCEHLRAAIFEPGSGSPLFDLLDKPDGKAGVESAGTLLAAIHQIDVPMPNPRHSAKNEIALVSGWCEVFDAVKPDMARKIRVLCDQLAVYQPRKERRLCTAHRDFYDKQVLYSPSRTTALDLDTACMAPAGLDLGNFCAHLTLRGLQRHGDSEHFKEHASRFVNAYRKAGGGCESRNIAWYQAMSLLRLAGLYALQLHDSAVIGGLVQEAASISDEFTLGAAQK
ncbi:phosphotransferase family protein, partial [Acidobacteriota bacterium]